MLTMPEDTRFPAMANWADNWRWTLASPPLVTADSKVFTVIVLAIYSSFGVIVTIDLMDSGLSRSSHWHVAHLRATLAWRVPPKLPFLARPGRFQESHQTGKHQERRSVVAKPNPSGKRHS